MSRENAPMHVDELGFNDQHDLELELDPDDVWKEVAYKYQLSPREVRTIEVDARNQSVSPSRLLFRHLQRLNVTVSDLCRHLVEEGFLAAAAVLYPHADGKTRRLFESEENLLDGREPVASSDDSEAEGSQDADSEASSAEAESEEVVERSQVQSIQLTLPSTHCKTVQRATNNFSREHLVDEGSYSSTYRADIDGTLYAVKVLDAKKLRLVGVPPQRLWQDSFGVFLHRHRHILPLQSYSNDGDPDCLLFEFAENGSLRRALDNKTLDSQQRGRILQQVASALSYLHSHETPVAHGDLNSSHILLDAHYDVRIAGLELARWVASKSITCADSQLLRSKESRLSLPTECLEESPESAERIFTTRTDMFSFGIILLEILTGLPAYDESRGEKDRFIAYHVLNQPAAECFARRADESAHWTQTTFLSLLTLAVECLNETHPHQRPSIDQVIQQLSRLNQVQPQSPKRRKSTSTSSILRSLLCCLRTRQSDP